MAGIADRAFRELCTQFGAAYTVTEMVSSKGLTMGDKKSGELLTRSDVLCVMQGKRMVFNQPILEKIVERFKRSINVQIVHQDALIRFEIDEYDERFLRHLALGYTKEQISNLRAMPFGVKSLEKRQNELVQKLFPDGNGGLGVNATRLVVRALQLRILDIDNLAPDEE